MELRQYQRAGVEFLKANKYALLADEPGLGKTAQALTAAAELGIEDVLVVCPASVKHAWMYQSSLWAPDMPYPTVITYDAISRKKQDKESVWGLIIFDESHYLKNPKAKRTRECIGIGVKSLAAQADKVWCLTGTPVLNRPVELYPALRAFCPHLLGKYRDFYSFGRRYCQAHQTVWGWDTTGASHTDELAGILKSFMLRRTVREVGDQVPDNIITVERIDVSDELRYLILRERANALNAAQERHKIAGLKIPTTIEFVKDLMESEEKVVVWYWHRDVALEMGEQLSDFKPLHIGGDTPVDKRPKIIKDFHYLVQHRVLLAQLGAAGTGTDGLQHACHTAVFAEIDYAPKRIEQAMSRLRRIGQKDKVRSYFIVVPGSIEEDIVSALEYKENVIRVLTGDDKRLGGGDNGLSSLALPRKTKEITEFKNQEE